MNQRNIVDVHHHVYPKAIRDELERTSNPWQRALVWTPAKSLEFMQKAGIERAVVSIDDPGTEAAPPRSRPQLARRCNEYLASLAGEYPGQFIPLATLPLPDVDVALRELEYALDTLKLAGICVMSNADGTYLGSDGQEELFAECDRRAIPIMIHPNLPPNGVHDALLEYTHDVTRALANLVFRGILERFRRLRLVLSHAGGTLSYIRDRVLVVGLESYIDRKAFVSLLLRYWKRSRALRRAYLDLTGATNRFSLATISRTADPSRLLYGSGFPHCSVADAVEARSKLDPNVLEENCQGLFPSTEDAGIPARR